MTDRLDEAGRRYDEAVENAREAIEELKLASYALGYEDAQKDAKLREISDTILTPEKLAKLDQKNRDEIVAKAKADVYDLLKERQISADEMEFITDQKRRVVVAKIKHLFSGFTLTEGNAKCNPDDCFNVHIGKAIALRRALGLAIPSYYLNAPQPTEVRVGDIVKTTDDNFPMWGNGKVIRIEKPYTIRGYFVEDNSYNHVGDTKIIDDSRE